MPLFSNGSMHSMKRAISCIAMFIAVPACAAGADCLVADRPSMLTLNLAAFDQTPESGWRILQDKGCFAEAADLIEEYVRLHGHTYVLAFHGGQLRLKAGSYAAARELFEQAKRSDMEADNPLKWNEFVDAYLAFIGNDRERLQKARDAIAVRTDFWGNRANLAVVEKMLKNLGKPYVEAIGAR